ncbi:MAG: TetR/AcrR family transcriptional regulator [Candidatus Eremiobacteraeota bacterium]|nr:TetR/AcrR family transcriptional regulator [Candidatus Eremiobacteraeota bacterium]
MIVDRYSKRQQQIIEAAINLIASDGIQKLSIRNLTRNIGITEPALYRHFDSKQDLLIEILNYFEETGKVINDEICTIYERPLECIEKFLLLKLENLSRNPALASVIFSEEIFRYDGRLSKKVQDIMRKNRDFIEKLVITGQETGEVRSDIPGDQISMIILGTIRLLVKRWRLSDFSFNLEDEGRRLKDTIIGLISEGK